jgi:gliding motility-associated-like protein
MKKNSTLISLVSFQLFISFFCFSQKEGNYWYFGSNSFGNGCAGINFNIPNGPIIALTDGKIPLTGDPEGVATISDYKTGDLLFYTDGVTVWNKSHSIMTGGTGLYGDQSSTQAVNILKSPDSGNDSIYYLFTTTSPLDPPSYFAYSVVNMKKNAGLGEVITKNVILDSMITEKQTFVKHSNCNDIWTVIHKSDNNTFEAFLLSNTGVNSTPVISTAGAFYTNLTYSVGSMASSNCGNYIACAIWGSDFIEVLDFNNSFGSVSNPRTITTSVAPYGLAFSADDSKLYMNNGNIYQYDLSYGWADLNTIISTVSQLNTDYAFNSGLELAPDGKIYSCRLGGLPPYYLSAINYPNKAGTDCGYNEKAVLLTPGTQGNHGLPHHFYYPKNKPSFTIDSLCIASGMPISFTDSTYFESSCNHVLKWEFGDGATSGVNNPHHTYTNANTYNVKLIASSGLCNISQDTIVKNLKINEPGISGILIPTIFSPNGDKLNDLYGIPLKETPGNYNLKIYNRWGEELFNSTDPAIYWDGKYNDQVIPEGTYFYILQLSGCGQQTIETKTGFITLVR